MTDEDYTERFNRFSNSLVPLFPGGKMPESDEDRKAAIALLRAKRESLEQLAVVSRIEAHSCYALEAQIMNAASEDTIKELRQRDKGNEIGKLIATRSKTEAAIKTLMAAGFSEEAAKRIASESKEGKL